MQRTSPPPISSPRRDPRPGARRTGAAGAGGFTLVEILVALVIAVMLCAAIAAGLALVIREEGESADAQEMSLAIRTVSAVRTLDPAAASAPPLGGLAAEHARIEVGTGDDKDVWEQWSIYRPDRPSRRLRLLFPTNGVPEP